MSDPCRGEDNTPLVPWTAGQTQQRSQTQPKESNSEIPLTKQKISRKPYGKIINMIIFILKA